MRGRRRRAAGVVGAAAAAVLVAGVAPGGARGEPIVPGGARAGLEAQMTRHERQFYGLNAVPFGLSLDVHEAGAEARAAIDGFLAGDGWDVEAATGKHAYELVASYGEHGDLGMFGGVAVAATAYQYMVARRDGAPAEVVARARARVVRAAEAWHLFYVVTGGGGLVARGIRGLVSGAGEPPLPGAVPALVPLFDGDGAPLPQPKNNGTWRADHSGGALPAGAWVWEDSCSKDQLVGQVFGMVALYDAMKGDPDIDQGLVERLAEDARGVAAMLMEVRDIGAMEGPSPLGARVLYDLIIMDADGRPTYHHDLNPLSFEKLYVDEGSGWNVFNLVMSWGILKGLQHVTGDAGIEAYLYEELLGARGYLEKLNGGEAEGAFDYIYVGLQTNFSNVNMIATALWLALYLERDAAVAAELGRFLEERWWDKAGEGASARHLKQPFFAAVYMGLTAEGVPGALVEDAAGWLERFSLGPYWNDARVNCDAGEIAAGVCVAVDGVTEIVLAGQSEGKWKAAEALDPAIRPPSNFDARSDPFDVNGGGGSRLNPGGDLLAAYWMMRWLEASGVGERNVSPFARVRGGGGGGAEEAVAEAVAEAGAGEVGPEAAAETGAEAVGEAVAEAAPEVAGGGAGGRAEDGCGAGGSRSAHWMWMMWLAVAGGGVLRRTRRRGAR